MSIIVQDLKDAHEYGELNKEYMTVSTKSALQQVEFMSKTIDDFRNFFVPSKRKITFDVKSTIEELLSMFMQIFSKSNIDVSIKVNQGTVLSTKGYPNEFKQVILNILHSTVKCNKRRSDFNWCFITQTFFGSVINQ